MKFVITYTTRSGGTAAENVASAESAQKLLAGWAPSGTTHLWVQRCDGQGGFAVVENERAADLLRDLATWSPWLEFELYPVVDITESTAIGEDALAAARAAL